MIKEEIKAEIVAEIEIEIEIEAEADIEVEPQTQSQSQARVQIRKQVSCLSVFRQVPIQIISTRGCYNSIRYDVTRHVATDFNESKGYIHLDPEKRIDINPCNGVHVIINIPNMTPVSVHMAAQVRSV